VNLLVNRMLLQSVRQGAIWVAAVGGDEALLKLCLEGATPEDLNFEKELVGDQVNIRPHSSKQI
jgi:hypothetical protein